MNTGLENGPFSNRYANRYGGVKQEGIKCEGGGGVGLSRCVCKVV